MTPALNLRRGLRGRIRQASITYAQSAKQTTAFQEHKFLHIYCGIYLKQTQNNNPTLTVFVSDSQHFLAFYGDGRRKSESAVSVHRWVTLLEFWHY